MDESTPGNLPDVSLENGVPESVGAAERKSPQRTELEELCADTDTWISRALDRLGWTREHLVNDTAMLVTCPIDGNHRLPATSLGEHVRYCRLFQEDGYTRSELDEDQSSKFFYEKAPKVVTIELDDNKLREILSQTSGGWTAAEGRRLPRTVSRAMAELTNEERRNIYDFCVAEAHACSGRVTIPADQLQLLDDKTSVADDKALDPNSLESLLKARDAKRKRQTYRAKNVHTTRKTHTEIIRDVLANQMELLKQNWEAEEKERKSLQKEISACKQTMSAGSGTETARVRGEIVDDAGSRGGSEKGGREEEKGEGDGSDGDRRARRKRKRHEHGDEHRKERKEKRRERDHHSRRHKHKRSRRGSRSRSASPRRGRDRKESSPPPKQHAKMSASPQYERGVNDVSGSAERATEDRKSSAAVDTTESLARGGSCEVPSDVNASAAAEMGDGCVHDGTQNEAEYPTA